MSALGGDPHRGSALNSKAIVGTFHADRSWPGGLAICCRAGSLRLRHDLCCWRALVWAPLDRRHLVSLAVRGAVRVLDLLSAPRTAAENDYTPECADQHGGAGAGRTCRPGSAAKAAQSGYRYHPAQPGHRRLTACRACISSTSSARGSVASAGRSVANARGSARCPGSLGLQAAANDVFS
jgi:hypothetical protein